VAGYRKPAALKSSNIAIAFSEVRAMCLMANSPYELVGVMGVGFSYTSARMYLYQRDIWKFCIGSTIPSLTQSISLILRQTFFLSLKSTQSNCPLYRFKLILLFSLCLFIGPCLNTAQAMVPDSSQAKKYQENANEFSKEFAYDSSFVYCTKAMALFKENSDWENFVKCGNLAADNLARKAEYDRALSYLEAMLDITKKFFQEDRASTAQTYNLLGYVHYYRQDYELAVRYLKEALRIRKKVLGGNSAEVVHTLYTLGITFRAMGKYDDGETVINDALAISESNNSKNDIASNLIALANICSDKGNYGDAIRLLTNAMNIFIELGQDKSDIAGTCYFCLARDFLKRDQLVRATSFLAKSMSIDTALFGENHPAVSACYAMLGDIYSLKGDYDQAIMFYTKASEIMIKVNGERHSGLAELYTLLSDLYAKKHKFEESLDFAQRSLSIQKHNYGDVHLSTANSLEHLANVYDEEKNYSEALKHLRNSLKIKTEIVGDKNIIVAKLYLSMGKVFTKANVLDSAEYYLERSYVSYEQSDPEDSLFSVLYHQAYGDLYYKKGDILMSLESYGKAIDFLSGSSTDSLMGESPDISHLGSESIMVECLVAESKSFEALYIHSHDLKKLDDASSCFDRAIRMISAIRRSYKAEESRLFLGEESYGVYKNAVRIALELYSITSNPLYKEKAFASAERAKGQLLFDRVRETEAIHFSDAPDSLLEKDISLKTSLIYFATQIQIAEKNKQVERANEFRDKYFAKSMDYNRLLDTLGNSYPKYYELKYKDKPIDITEIQHALDRKTTVVDYFFIENRLCIFTISKQSFDVTVEGNISKINETASLLRRSLRTVDEKLYLTTSASLFKMIVSPITPRIQGNHLVIIPDGDLYYIPFEALLSKDQIMNSGADYSTLPYLIRNYAVSYCYSTTLFMSQKEKHPQKIKHSFIGFAPVFKDSAQNHYPYSMNASDPDIHNESKGLRVTSYGSTTYNGLEYSASEITQISELFREKHYEHASFLFNEANKDNFKRLIPNYDYVHIASHGYADDEHPALSALMFARPNGTLSEDDGVLYASETYDLNLNADLVVLSSCESGLGRLVKGEGLMGMTRGFFYSGARNIIFSLWKVPDLHTNRLMVEFYKYLLSGEDIPHALQKAKLRMIYNDPTAFPSKWTGFVLLSTN